MFKVFGQQPNLGLVKARFDTVADLEGREETTLLAVGSD